MPAKEPQSRLHMRLTGRVQGVGFRAFVAQQARDFSITGWVRNVGGNQVEIVAEGKRVELERFLQRARKGPSMAAVNNTQTEWSDARGEFERFKIRWL